MLATVVDSDRAPTISGMTMERRDQFLWVGVRCFPTAFSTFFKQMSVDEGAFK